jgi:hypothetical protein
MDNTASFGEFPTDEAGPDEQSVLSQWLGRVAVTILIAAIYHWWVGPRTATSDVSTGNRLEKDWNVVVNEEQQHESTPMAHKRSALLDRLEGKYKTNTLIYDDIHHDDETDDNSHPLIYDDIEEEDDDDNQVHKSQLSNNPPDLENHYPNLDSLASTSAQTVDLTTSITAPTTDPSPPRLKAADGIHPGLDGFRRWYDVEASLYRIYTIGRTDGVEVHPPFIPKSERGHVSLKLKVANNYRETIAVYWIDYKGKEVHKGNIPHGSVFHQTTWIGHPWIFREKESGALLCHCIPYKVIPTTHQVPTVNKDEPEIGIHQFAILSLGQRKVTDEGVICSIADPAFPTHMETPQDAIAWTFQEMSRCEYPYIDTVAKYLTNIVLHPADSKYRQIRIAHRRFAQQVWNTSARGLFLAAGFVEEGPYAELGSNDGLPRGRVQDLSTLLFYLEKWKRIQDMPLGQQPEGADGSGRANYG